MTHRHAASHRYPISTGKGIESGTCSCGKRVWRATFNGDCPAFNYKLWTVQDVDALHGDALTEDAERTETNNRKASVMTITTEHTVTAFFDNSAGNRIEFAGAVIRTYSIRNLLPMVEVDTPNGPMHAQVTNATVTGTQQKAPKVAKAAKASAVGERRKVRGNEIVEGMTITVVERTLLGEAALYSDHRITMSTAVKVTGAPTIEMRQGGRKASRFYNIPVSHPLGVLHVSASQTITVVSN